MWFHKTELFLLVYSLSIIYSKLQEYECAYVDTLIVTHLGDPRKADTVLLGGCALLCPEAPFLCFLMRPAVLACPEAFSLMELETWALAAGSLCKQPQAAEWGAVPTQPSTVGTEQWAVRCQLVHTVVLLKHFQNGFWKFMYYFLWLMYIYSYLLWRLVFLIGQKNAVNSRPVWRPNSPSCPKHQS